MRLAANEQINVWVIRHPRERIAKCSLRHLHNRTDFSFLKASPQAVFDLSGCLLLDLNAPVLKTEDDATLPLVILDSTWRLLPQMIACVTGIPVRRSLPATIHTAYPRVSKLTPDPYGGLASVEALYVAQRILGKEDPSVLEGYYWKETFLRQF